MFVDLKNGDISKYVDKVQFELHETFKNPKKVITKKPFELSMRGWGTFDIPVTIYFKKGMVLHPGYKEFDHCLSFDGNGK